MSTILAGGVMILDPSDSIPIQFTWDDKLATVT